MNPLNGVTILGAVAAFALSTGTAYSEPSGTTRDETSATSREENSPHKLGPDFLFGPIVGGWHVEPGADASNNRIRGATELGWGRSGQLRISTLNRIAHSDSDGEDDLDYQPNMDVRWRPRPEWDVSFRYREPFGELISPATSGFEGSATYLSRDGETVIEQDENDLTYYFRPLMDRGQVQFGLQGTYASRESYLFDLIGRQVSTATRYGLLNTLEFAASMNLTQTTSFRGNDYQSISFTPAVEWRPTRSFRMFSHYAMADARLKRSADRRNSAGTTVPLDSRAVGGGISHLIGGSAVPFIQIPADQLGYYGKAPGKGQFRSNVQAAYTTNQVDYSMWVADVSESHGVSDRTQITMAIAAEASQAEIGKENYGYGERLLGFSNHSRSVRGTATAAIRSYVYDPSVDRTIPEEDFLFGQLVKPNDWRMSLTAQRVLVRAEGAIPSTDLLRWQGLEKQSPPEFGIGSMFEWGLPQGHVIEVRGAYCRTICVDNGKSVSHTFILDSGSTLGLTFVERTRTGWRLRWSWESVLSEEGSHGYFIGWTAQKLF